MPSTSTSKAFFCHPKEWALGIVLLPLILYARFFLFSDSHLRSSARSNSWMFENASSDFDVQYEIQRRYCQLDAQIQCPRIMDEAIGKCDRAYGIHPVPNLLRTTLSRSNCTLAYFFRFPTNGWKFDDLRESHPELNIPTDPDEEDFIRLMLTSYLALWVRTKTLIGLHTISGHQIGLPPRSAPTLRTGSMPHRQIPQPQQPYERNRRGLLRTTRTGSSSRLIPASAGHTVKDWERMLAYYLSSILEWLTGPNINRELIFADPNKNWSEERIAALMKTSLKILVVYPRVRSQVDEPGFRKYLLPKLWQVLEKLEYRVTKQKLVPQQESGNQKQAYWLFSSYIDGDCMYHHFKSNTLITETCSRAMDEAPHKIREIEMEERAEFLFFTHFTMYGIHFTSALVFLNLYTAKKRLKKKLDRSRQRLEAELNDPFLRASLEHKAAQSPDGGDLIRKLEEKAANWDSKDAASNLVRRYVRRFKLLQLFVIGSTSFAYLMLHVFKVSSMAKYLEILFLSVLMITGSYFVPSGKDDSKDEGSSDSEVMMTKSLLRGDGVSTT